MARTHPIRLAALLAIPLGVLLAATAHSAFGQAAPAHSVPGHDDPRTRTAMGDGMGTVTPLAADLATDFAAEGVAKTRPAARMSLSPLTADDVAHARARARDKTQVVGVVRAFDLLASPVDLDSAPDVVVLADGTRVITLEVSAPGAVGLRVRLSRVELPAGAEVIVYDAAEPTEAYGPWSGRGPHGTGEFYSPTVFGETARVELRVAPGVSLPARAVEVDAVVHRFVSDEVALSAHHAAKAGPCHNSVACDADVSANQARAVAFFQTVEAGVAFTCTGSLIADTDDATAIPWFATANHCVVNDKVARTVECFWDYRAFNCGGFVPPLFNRPRTLGATLVATSVRVDTTVLRLTGRLPSNRFFPGFSVNLLAAGADLFGVHHPASDHMRVSYGTLTQRRTDYLDVLWHSGVTEPGSSGSPLYNTAGELVGVLSGGLSSCSLPIGHDQYGRFDRAFSLLGLDAFLLTGDASGIGDEWDPFDDYVSGATPVTIPTDGSATHGPHSLDGTDIGDWFRFEVERGGTYSLQTDADAGLHAALHRGNQASRPVLYRGAPNLPLTFRAARSGTYWLRVRSVGGETIPAYTLRAELTTPPPVAVTELTATPDARGRVRLRWRDVRGNATRYDVERRVETGGEGAEWVAVGSTVRRAFRQFPGPGAGAHLYRVTAHNPAGDAGAEIAAEVVGAADDAFDPLDDDALGATALNPGGATSGPRSLSGTDLRDWYRIDLSTGQTVALETSGRGDPEVELFGPSDLVQPLAMDRNSGRRRNVSLTFTATETGTHRIRVHAARSGRRLRYELTVGIADER